MVVERVVRPDVGMTKNDRGLVLSYGDVLPELKKLILARLDATKAVKREQEAVVPWVFHRTESPSAASGRRGTPATVTA